MRGHPLTKRQIEELLSSYRNMGLQATKQLAISFGIAPRYLARLARRNGYANNYQYGRVYVRKSSWQDPRWQRAIERGAILV
jgi:hypothetical protein